MSERGVFAIDRGLYNAPTPHHVFKDEPFTEREAWVWMIGEAAFGPTKRRIGRTSYDLSRGQLAAATRFMAGKWQWTESRVRRFLERLKNERMIDALPTPDATLITVCKYDEYQFGRRAHDATNDALATHSRRKEEELEEQNNRSGSGSARETPSEISPEAHSLAMELAAIAGHDPSFLPTRWMSDSPVYWVQHWLAQGLAAPMMREVATTIMRGKEDGPAETIRYFRRAFERTHRARLKIRAEPVLPLGPVPLSSESANAQTDRFYSNPRLVRSGGFAAFARDRAKSAG